MPSPILLPCPFCGAPVEVHRAPAGTIMFVCHVCGADVCFFGAEHPVEKAVAAWNGRAGGKETK